MIADGNAWTDGTNQTDVLLLENLLETFIRMLARESPSYTSTVSPVFSHSHLLNKAVEEAHCGGD